MWRDSNFAAAFAALKRSGQANAAQLLARYTGGMHISFFRQAAVERAIQAIGEDIHRQYILSFTPPPGRSGFRALSLTVRNRPDLQVRTRAGYWAVP